jgi:hypothetical protein
MQAVSDVPNHLLDLSIVYGGASSACQAFSESQLYQDLQNGILVPVCFYLVTMCTSTAHLWPLPTQMSAVVPRTFTTSIILKYVLK